MHCYQCSAVAEVGAGFCQKCGTKLGFTQDLINAAMAKEERSITFLYNETYNSVYQAIRPLIRDEDTALDILQDTYIKAFESLAQLEKPEQFRAWVKSIATNKSKDWLKKKKPTLFSELSAQEDSDEPDFSEERIFALPDAALDKRETKRLLWDIIDSLSDDQRLVVSMYYFQELPVKEIAADLGISENTVKSRLNYARKNIESKVLMLEKQGTRLYSLAPLPFLLWLFRSGAEAPSTAAITKIARALGISVGTAAASTAGTASGGATNAAASTTANATANTMTATAAATSGTAAGTAAGVGIAAKIAAIVAAAAVIVGGAAIATSMLNKEDQEPERPVFEQTDFTSTPEPDSAREPSSAPSPSPTSAVTNADRIDAYVSYVENADEGEAEPNMYLLYDADGDGLDELLMIVPNSYIDAYVLTANARGDVETLFSSSDAGAGGRADVEFVWLTYRGQEYFTHFHSGSSSNGADKTYFYESFQMMDVRDGKLEVVHELTHDATYSWEHETTTDEASFIDDEPLEHYELVSIVDSAESIMGTFSDIGMGRDEFLSTYKK